MRLSIRYDVNDGRAQVPSRAETQWHGGSSRARVEAVEYPAANDHRTERDETRRRRFACDRDEAWRASGARVVLARAEQLESARKLGIGGEMRIIPWGAGPDSQCQCQCKAKQRQIKRQNSVDNLRLGHFQSKTIKGLEDRR